jgi:hypothetical protein
MKQLYWAKVPNMLVPKAFWMKATDVSDKLNTMVLEDMFAMDETTPLQAAPRHAAPKTLLDSKRAQNLGIFLSGFKMSVDEIDTKLNIVDSDKGLPLESVMALKRFQPTEEDVEMYSNFSGDKASLPPTDQFMMKVLHIIYVD